MSASVLKNVEYLVVLKVGTGEPVPIAPKLIVEGGAVGAEFNYDGRDVRVLFDRAGPVRGRIAIKGGATAASREFAKGIEDTFSRWNRDPNYQKWMTQERFRFVVNKTEKQKAGE